MLKVQVGDGSEWESCKVYFMAHGPNFYVRILINGDTITLYEHAEIIAPVFEDLARRMRLNPAPASPMAVQDHFPEPSAVVAHFQQSKELRAIAPDVEKLLGPADDLTMVLKAVNITDLVVNGKPKWGAKSKIAKVLGVQYAGSYIARVDHVLEQIISTTALNSGKGGNLCA